MLLNGTMLVHCCVVFTFIAADFSRLVATDSFAFFLFHPIPSCLWVSQRTGGKGKRGKGERGKEWKSRKRQIRKAGERVESRGTMKNKKTAKKTISKEVLT